MNKQLPKRKPQLAYGYVIFLLGLYYYLLSFVLNFVSQINYFDITY